MDLASWRSGFGLQRAVVLVNLDPPKVFSMVQICYLSLLTNLNHWLPRWTTEMQLFPTVRRKVGSNICNLCWVFETNLLEHTWRNGGTMSGWFLGISWFSFFLEREFTKPTVFQVKGNGFKWKCSIHEWCWNYSGTIHEALPFEVLANWSTFLKRINSSKYCSITGSKYSSFGSLLAIPGFCSLSGSTWQMIIVWLCFHCDAVFSRIRLNSVLCFRGYYFFLHR